MTTHVNQITDDGSAPVDFSKFDQASSDALCREAERWLYREARLLDTEQFDSWLEEMVHPDVHYLVESQQHRYRKERRYEVPGSVPLYDDNYEFLRIRVEQCASGLYWRMDPPERYRRLVTNVEAFEIEGSDVLAVRSNCQATRTRRIYDIDHFIYCREDMLTRSMGNRWQLLSRHVEFDERCVSGRNMVMFL